MDHRFPSLPRHRMAPCTACPTRYLQRLGRGKDLPDQDLIFPDTEEALNTPCPWAVRSAALSPSNHLVACCGIEAEGNPVLDFGSASEMSVTTLVNRADNSLLVNAIALLGPVYLKRFLTERAPEIAWRPRYSSVCEVCEHLVTRPEVTWCPPLSLGRTCPSTPTRARRTGGGRSRGCGNLRCLSPHRHLLNSKAAP